MSEWILNLLINNDSVSFFSSFVLLVRARTARCGREMGFSKKVCEKQNKGEKVCMSPRCFVVLFNSLILQFLTICLCWNVFAGMCLRRNVSLLECVFAGMWICLNVYLLECVFAGMCICWDVSLLRCVFARMCLCLSMCGTKLLTFNWINKLC